MRLFSALALAAGLVSLMGAAPALAEGWREHGDIHRFHERDYGAWREGHWFHGPHEGRHGWWWTVDGMWYFYPQPVYPYPDPYVPPAVVLSPGPAEVLTAPPSYVYFCRRPAGYYPYISTCFVPWQRRLAESEVGGAPMMMSPVPGSPVMSAPVMGAPSVSSLSPAPAGQRELDDRQLNALGAELEGINQSRKGARTALKSLAGRVESFHEELFTRTYNAMDILKDTESLQQRIEAARKRLGS